MRFIVSFLVFVGIWIVLTEGRIDSWVVGGPVVFAATCISMRLAERQRWRWSVFGFFRFAPYFASTSFLGGLDVAWRSLSRSLPIDPCIVEHHLRLPDDTAARVFFMNIVNLLPGTVSADVDQDILKVHVIDGTQPTIQSLTKLEKIVAALFAILIDGNNVSEGGTP